jgi:hypothetical protein
MTIENEKHTLASLLKTVQDQSARSADYIAPTNQLQIRTTKVEDKPNRTDVIIEAHHGQPTVILEANGVAQDQIAQKAKLDVKTARRLREDYPDVYDHAIRRIWDQEPAKHMVRAHLSSQGSGVARAVVSDRFKTFDNSHLLEATLPQLMESEAQWQVVHGDVTDKRLYLRLKSNVITADRIANPVVDSHAGHRNGLWLARGENPDLPATRAFDGAERAVGDVMALGIGISNSEVGLGSIQVYQCVWTIACLNALQTEHRNRQAHLTSARGDEDVIKYLTAEAIDADNHSLSLKLRDLVAAYASRETFDNVIEKMRRAAEDVVEQDAPAAVEALGQVLQLTKKGTSNVLDGLLQTIQQPGYAGQPISRATMVNAVTAVAHAVGPDDVDEWQKLGGKVLDLPARDWNVVAKAA